MQYKVLYYNDDNTAKVQMTIGTRVLEQDFDVTDLDANVKQGMAVFQAELQRNVPDTNEDPALINKTVQVDVLPQITDSIAPDTGV